MGPPTVGGVVREAAETCASFEAEAPDDSALGTAIEDAADAEGDDDEGTTISIDVDDAGLARFAGPRRPAALAEPIAVTRLPCLGPRPDPAFGCTTAPP